MKGKGLVLTVSHLLFDAAMVEQFVSIEEIRNFVEEPVSDIQSTVQVLHNISIAVTEQEYKEALGRVTARLSDQNPRTMARVPSQLGLLNVKTRYTLNPIIHSLIDRGIASTPIYEALRIVISELISQWENAATKGKLTEFTEKISTTHKEGLETEISRRVALREGCNLTEEEVRKLREFPTEVGRFKTIWAAKFVKAYQIGGKLGVKITPSDVIWYISNQLRVREVAE
ncbi:MAG: hypothetical protein WED05_07605 [Candidatus Atabeyarchaeum deiterrae]